MPKLNAQTRPPPTIEDNETDLVIDPDTGKKPRTTFLDLGDKELLGLDPGEMHVGWTEYAKDHLGQTACVVAIEITPDEALANLESMLANDVLFGIAYENFTLAPDKAEVQFGKEMTTSEMIGVIKYKVKVHNETAIATGRPERVIKIYKVSRNTKKPIARQLKARRISRITAGKSTHVKDAEVIGWYPILYHADNGG